MTEIDKQIRALGYESSRFDLICGYIVYENKKGKEVTIEWDNDDNYCRIFSRMFGMAASLSIREAEIFIAKIKEMRKGL